jgi:predicted ATPase/class 3 adenylate cyclase/tetratricopeptide (TPR) repeat protein
MTHMEGELPSGTVTFLFTDLVGSSRMWEEHPEAMKGALARHDAILRDAVEGHDGQVVKATGDGVHAAFGRPQDAVAAALEAQRALDAERWAETGPLRVRMGLHTGTAETRAGDYFGPALNRAARLAASAHGGQVVVSEATVGVVRDVLPVGVGLDDLGEQRLRDLTRPERVFQLVHADLPREFPPLRSLEAVPGNLPVQVTSFVGRDQDSERVAATLEQARVVTLTGVGGVGKTRLALHVAGMTSMSARHRDGCWLCELGAVRDPEAVPDALVAAFGVEPRQGVTVSDALLEYLRTKELLVVLDNCEHLLQPVGELVARIEQSCADVQILATSREGLGVAGEWIHAVGSLPVAEPGADLEAVRSCDAVHLFVERAQSVKTDFELDTANADAVAQICQRLDGIALAIELAAARVTTLSAAELAGRLDQRFRVLAGGHRSAVKRHQTLRAAIDWSYELLSEPEQRMLDRLSVFAGGFTLKAAEAVTVGKAVERQDVFDLLAALVSRSLVEADTRGPETRYRLLETIRDYAQELLDRRGETSRIRTRHARWYATYAESVAAAHSAAPDDFEWEDELDREVDNLRAAFTWAVDTQDSDTALRLLGNVPVPGVSNVALAFRSGAEATIALPGASGHPNLPAALAAAASFANQRGEQDLALRLSDEALAAERRLGTTPDAPLLHVRGFIAMSMGAFDDDIEYTRRAADVHRARGDTAGLAVALGHIAVVRTMLGDRAGAIRGAEEALACARTIDARGATMTTLSLAAYALAELDPERALTLINEAIELNMMLGRTPGPMWGTASRIAATLGNRHDALRYLARAIEESHRIGTRPVLRPMLRRAGDLLAPDDPEAAAILHGASEGGMPSPQSEDDHRQAVATLDRSLGATRRKKLNEQGERTDEDAAISLALDAIRRAANPHDNIDATQPSP